MARCRFFDIYLYPEKDEILKFISKELGSSCRSFSDAKTKVREKYKNWLPCEWDDEYETVKAEKLALKHVSSENLAIGMIGSLSVVVAGIGVIMGLTHGIGTTFSVGWILGTVGFSILAGYLGVFLIQIRIKRKALKLAYCAIVLAVLDDLRHSRGGQCPCRAVPASTLYQGKTPPDHQQCSHFCGRVLVFTVCPVYYDRVRGGACND